MSLSYSHGREFVEQARLLLETKDVSSFIRFLERYWPADLLRELLTCGHEDAVKIALAGLSLLGDMSHCAAIAPLLHDDDGDTASLAEHTLWALWFRAGTASANDHLAQAVRSLSENQLDKAAESIHAAVRESADFAEAYHQLAMIEFLRSDYQQGLTHCRAALVLNPWHFGAMAGLGHCYAALGEYDRAQLAYHRALQLNPRLEGVRQAIRQIRHVSGRPESSIA